MHDPRVEAHGEEETAGERASIADANRGHGELQKPRHQLKEVIDGYSLVLVPHTPKVKVEPSREVFLSRANRAQNSSSRRTFNLI